MSKIKDITGQKFGKLTAVSRTENCRWIFSCECGSPPKQIRSADVKCGKVISCGCHRDAVVIKRNKESATRDCLTHSYTGKSWNAVMSRCFNKNYHSYREYGAVGITACEFIRATPLNLLLLIGERPTDYTIDRIENSGSYTCGKCRECLEKGWPFNVRWATRAEQCRNQKRNHRVEIGGKVLCVADWALLVGIDESSFRGRLKAGWSSDRLLSKPKCP